MFLIENICREKEVERASMNVMNTSGDDLPECPLCMEPLEVDDLSFFPCTCGYQICRFCWHRIRTDENELCPACRKAYPENPADFKPLTQEQVSPLPFTASASLTTSNFLLDFCSEGGKAPTRPATKAEDHGEPKAFSERSSSSEESRVCRRVAAATRRRRDPEEARILRQVREDPQSGYQSEYDVRGRAGTVCLRLRHLRPQQRRAASHSECEQHNDRRPVDKDESRHHQVLLAFHEEPSVSEAGLHVPSRARRHRGELHERGNAPREASGVREATARLPHRSNATAISADGEQSQRRLADGLQSRPDRYIGQFFVDQREIKRRSEGERPGGVERSGRGVAQFIHITSDHQGGQGEREGRQ